MKQFLLNGKAIAAALVSCLILFTGCMDLFDDEEVPTAWMSGSFTVDVESVTDIQLFSYVVSGENDERITFTADKEYETYEWYISCEENSVGNESSYEWDTINVPAGQYYVTLVVTDSESVTRNATMVVVVHK